ncbi:hypothetical protein ABIE89_000356 [Bradyrhizobium niftali]
MLAYDLNRTLERLPPPEFAGQRLPQSILHFYDVVISFDHRDKRCWVVSTGWPGPDPGRRIARARRRSDEFVALLAGSQLLEGDGRGAACAWDSNFSRDSYIAAVQRVIDLIAKGDIFQANIAQCFSARLSSSFDPIAFYCRLRSLNPAPLCGPAPLRSVGNSIKLAGAIFEALWAKGRNATDQGDNCTIARCQRRPAARGTSAGVRQGPCREHHDR